MMKVHARKKKGITPNSFSSPPIRRDENINQVNVVIIVAVRNQEF